MPALLIPMTTTVLSPATLRRVPNGRLAKYPNYLFRGLADRVRFLQG
jgi:hypothetical protein